jgi:hypothetical protein
MEARLGNLTQARGLFKAGLRIDTTNEACWEAWIKMEADADFLERADMLRTVRFQSPTSVALSASFSTLPDAAQGPVLRTVRARSFVRIYLHLFASLAS